MNRQRGTAGHLPLEIRNRILSEWQNRTRVRGTIQNIARQVGVSATTVSNTILVETGKRPSFHPDIEP